MANSLFQGVSLLAILIAVTGLGAAGCCEQEAHTKTRVSVSDVDKLGPDATWDDVVRLMNGAPPMTLPWFECRATEGGILVFSFFPTNEVAAPPTTPGRTEPLVAVVKCTSHAAFMRSEGVYVYPKEYAGMQFTGLALLETMDSE